jgi:hypothetical protein
MKNLFLLLFALVVLASTSSVQAQTSSVVLPNVYDLYQPVLRMPSESVVIYTHTYGIRDILPAQSIELNSFTNTYNVYNHTYGVRDILPSYQYRSTAPGVYNGYGTTNGIPNILPSSTIQITPNPFRY